VYGKAKYWNNTGYWEEVYGKPCKFRLKFWKTVP
jgi:hypothetical protein